MCLSVVQEVRGTRYPEARVTAMPPSVGPGNSNLGPLQKQCVLFLAEPSPALKVSTFQLMTLHVDYLLLPFSSFCLLFQGMTSASIPKSCKLVFTALGLSSSFNMSLKGLLSSDPPQLLLVCPGSDTEHIKKPAGKRPLSWLLVLWWQQSAERLETEFVT